MLFRTAQSLVLKGPIVEIISRAQQGLSWLFPALRDPASDVPIEVDGFKLNLDF
jgi:hypothetical protein